MNKLVSIVTICVLSMSFLSCSGPSSKETISFEKEPSFSFKIDRVVVDRLTMVLAVDDSASMISKTAELEQNMKTLFTDLIDANWDVDLHLVTCSFYKGQESDIKSVSTQDFKELTTQEKVSSIMKAASPKIDLSTLQNDADERCNESLEKAWSLIDSKNKINLSLIISNEDGCGRDSSNNMLVNLDGSPRNNCAPVTFNQIQGTLGSDETALKDRPVKEWTKEIEKYSNNVWLPWFDKNLKNKVHSSAKYVEFFKNLEIQGRKKVDNFSHIYLPIVVDSPSCLAETLGEQFAVKEQEALEKAFDERIGSVSDFVFDGLQDTRNILGNIGYSYIKTFDLLNQNIDFSKENGDLSLCNDLSHIVGKLSQEIKVRGSGLVIEMPRPLDVEGMFAAEGANFKILEIIRPAEVEENGFFEQRNILLKHNGLEWKKLNEDQWSLVLGMNSPYIKYNKETDKLSLLPNRLFSTTGGDEVIISEYETIGFKEN